MSVKIRLAHPESKLPTRGTDKAGGWDVYAAEIVRDPNHPDFVIVKTGLHMTPEPGKMIRISPRSSLTGTHWLIQNSPGLCDEDYIGEYQVRFRAIPTGVAVSYDAISPDIPVYSATLKYPEFPYKVGDRVAQMYKMDTQDFDFDIVDKLEETARGEGGYGSTGK